MCVCLCNVRMYEHASLCPCMYVLKYSVEITRTICVLYVCIQMYMCTHTSENVCACACVRLCTFSFLSPFQTCPECCLENQLKQLALRCSEAPVT